MLNYKNSGETGIKHMRDYYCRTQQFIYLYSNLAYMHECVFENVIGKKGLEERWLTDFASNVIINSS